MLMSLICYTDGCLNNEVINKFLRRSLSKGTIWQLHSYVQFENNILTNVLCDNLTSHMYTPTERTHITSYGSSSCSWFLIQPSICLLLHCIWRLNSYNDVNIPSKLFRLLSKKTKAETIYLSV